MAKTVGVELFLPLVTKKAFSAWRKLPAQHRAWIDVDDLIQEGLLYLKFSVLPRYRPNRSKALTFCFSCLDNFYHNIVSGRFRAKRNRCDVVEIDGVEYMLGDDGKFDEEIIALEALSKVMADASPLLRGYLKLWLLSSDKLYRYGRRFNLAKRELLFLSRRHGFGREEMGFLLHSKSWRVGYLRQKGGVRCLEER